jgi:ERCC4-type nuclease
MPIYVDNRGDGEKAIAEILSATNYPVQVQHVESGDFVFDEVGIERKTVSDLLNSLHSKEKGHSLWEQVKVLKDTYKKPYVLIEGFLDWKDRMICGTALAILDSWRIPILNSCDHAQSALIIGRLFERYGTARTSRVPPPAVKKGYTRRQMQVNMCQVIPHVGGVMANKIVDKNPHIFAWNYGTDYGTAKIDLNIQGLQKDSKQYLLTLLNLVHVRERE